MSDLAKRLAELSAQKKEFITLTLQQGAADSNSFPLSFGQERLWLLEQLQPGLPVYNMPVAFRVRGRIKPEILEQSLNEIVRRHESLRTAFTTLEGKPVQVITPHLTLAVPIVDLRAQPLAEREAQAVAIATQERATPFDLNQAPLVRATLLQLQTDDFILLLTLHHIIADGWSLTLLIQELVTLYTAWQRGRPAPLAELPIQYPDFALWQREQMQGEAHQAQIEYWKDQLEGVSVLELPYDHPRPPTPTFRGASQSRYLSKELSESLKSLGRQSGATLFMTLLAACKILLHRFTGQLDIAIGSPVAGRSHRQVESLIGFFLNTLILRTDLSGNPNFLEVLARVREVCFDAYAHQAIPFEHLLEALQPERNLSQTPWFQVFFNMLNFPEVNLDLPEANFRSLALPETGSKFDLTFYIAEREDGLRFDLAYSVDLFDEARIAELLAQYEGLLAQIVEDPQRRLSDYSLVTPPAQRHLPNPVEVLDPSWRGAVHQLFAQQARQTPHQLAVVEATETWSYHDLDQRSNQLAHALRAQGLGAQTVVAIYAHRSASLIWAMLAVFKAGGTYLLLDPAYPPARLIDYLTLAQPQGWLQLTAAGALPLPLSDYLASIPLACRWELPSRAVADSQNLFAQWPVDEPKVVIDPDDVACLGFTSGSTGKPKGILGRHGPLTHFLPWQRETFGLDTSDRYSLLSGLSHDPLQRDIFTPLCLGATICIPDPEQLASPGWLAGWMRRAAISIAHLTPAMGQLLTEAPGEGSTPDCLPDLRYAFFVGDVLTRREVRRLKKLAPKVTVVNYYGSTETQRAVGFFVVPPETAPPQRSREVIPLGRGIQDVQLLLLNSAQQLAGVGEAAEIYVRSPHLAKGYLADDALTRERFIPNPFTGQPGDRLYRTGDLGRYLPDGNVEPLGRADQQVKIRGFRIELGEIESLLGQHPAVKEAVVIAVPVNQEGSPQSANNTAPTTERRLAAYLVPNPGAVLHPPELRTFLRERLPDYMVPATYIFLETLPLTPNGKMDRRALPEPDWAHSKITQAPGRPRTQVEEILAGLWATVLGLEQVGLDDTFFDLGGHSLLATQIMSRLRGAFQTELPLRALFESPTVAGLAERIEAARQAADLPSIPASLTPIPRQGALAVSLAQQRLWFLDQLDPGNPVYNLHIAVRLNGSLDLAALAHSLDELIRRHESLRTTFSIEGGQPVQVIASSPSAPLRVLDLQGLATTEREAEVQRQAVAEAQRPFDLSQGPLFRASLLRLTETEQVCLVTLHHIIADGWSLGIFVRELAEIYVAFSNSQPSPLPALPIQYADFAHWQRIWLQGESLERQLAYWKHQLRDAPPSLDLPTDHPRPPVRSFRGARQSRVLPKALAQAIKTLGQQEGVTLFMTLLAAFQVLLYRYTGQTDICVGSPIAGRDRVEIEALIGFFVNTVVLRSRLEDGSGRLTFQNLLHRVREVVLEASLHQHLPFEQLVEALQPDRDLSHTPLFQVAFTLQTTTTPLPPLSVPGLTLSSLDVEATTAQFDLTLYLLELDQALQATLEYNTDLFEAATMTRLLGHFQCLLESIVADRSQPLRDLQLLSEAEHRQMIVEWNATQTNYPSLGGLHQFFEAQADRSPQALAVIGESLSGPGNLQQLTYSDLNEQANQLAHQLKQLGVGPGVYVAVYLNRSVEMITALLGILKAGGIYVPLEPSFPTARVQWILAALKINHVMTQATYLATLANLDPQRAIPRTLLCLDTPRLEGLSPAQVTQLLAPLNFSRLPTHNLPPQTLPTDLAYVIFTSGSTGTPKGVMVQHQPVINLIDWVNRTFAVQASDRVLFVTSLCFDLSVYDIFGLLAAGGSIRVANDAEVREPARLLEILGSEPITFWDSAPPALQQLTTLFPFTVGETNRLRLVFLSGDWIPVSLPDQVRQTFPHASVISLGGATEATVWSNYYPIQQVDPQWVSIPYGKPIQNSRYHVLDSALNPCPINAPGDLYIGGECLALGYANEPALTAEKFIPDPFAPTPSPIPSPVARGNRGGAGVGGRLYKTGDRARYWADGNLEFLGRLDHQVKVRGFRIELGEIETVLGQHPALQDSVVVALPAKSSAPGSAPTRREAERLVAYGVPSHERAAPVRQLLRWEREGQLANQRRYELPNGMTILHRTPSETDFMYQEIFAEQAYLKHNLKLNDGDCVFDVGANIGLFTLWVGRHYPHARLYAFEPLPPIFEVLRLNTALHGAPATLFECGLGSETKSEAFTYYPNISILSGRFADATVENATLRNFLQQQTPLTAEVDGAALEELLRERLTNQRLTVQLRTLSEVIAEHKLERIDLLKIDVEKSEGEVLAGICDGDWPKIKQIVVEVYDVDGRLAQVTELLQRQGYQIAVEQDSLLQQLGFYNIYAIRPESLGQVAEPLPVQRNEAPVWSTPQHLVNDLRRHLKEKLPDYMVPSAVLLLEALPLTPNGKIDRQALPALENLQLAKGFVAPRTPTEETLARLWADILGLTRIGVSDNFFELGGHSLLATQIISRVREVFEVDIPVRHFFESPTVADLAIRIVQKRSEHVDEASLAEILSMLEQLPEATVQGNPGPVTNHE